MGGFVDAGEWAAALPVTFQNVTTAPVEILKVEPIDVDGVEVAEVYLSGPRTPAWNGVFPGWPPGTPGEAGGMDPRISDFKPVEGFMVNPAESGATAAAGAGMPDVPKGLPNEATIVLKIRLEPGRDRGSVNGFKVTYRAEDDTEQVVQIPNAATGLCATELQVDQLTTCTPKK